VIRTIAAVDPAIARVPRGHFLLVDVLTALGTPEQRRRNARTRASHDLVAWKYDHVGNYLLNDVLPPNRGQI
jgi:alkylation response protein AidB-like acyl-CoA dehydrogenase